MRYNVKTADGSISTAVTFDEQCAVLFIRVCESEVITANMMMPGFKGGFDEALYSHRLFEPDIT